MERVEAHSANNVFANVLQPADFVRLFRSHWRWWAIPAVVFAVAAGLYSFVAPRNWQAAQALVVRPEVARVSEERLGKFADLAEMKTTQETILELAKSQIVVQATLREVGPPISYRRPEAWPSALDVEDFRACIDMRPPGGAEFGKTEVFYLSVKDTNRDRASALVVALCGQLEQRLQEIRDQSAQGMIAELERTVDMASGDLNVRTEQLSAFEAKVGADLAELRNLNAEVGGQGEIAQERQAIEAERRTNEARKNENERLLKLLVAAQKDPQQLLATPNSLLVSQPSVSQLKNAFVNAQLHTAELLGSRSEQHPFVIAARESENLIRTQLNREVAVAIRGLEVDIELCADREKSLSGKWDAARERMSNLAGARAEYSNLVAAVQNHTRLVEAARKNLADARARQAGAHSASVISRIDGVEAGVRPVGPARKTVAAAGGFGGLLFGFGLVFLFASPVPVAFDNAATGNSGNVVATGTVAPPISTYTNSAAVTPAKYASVEGSLAGRSRSTTESFGMFRGMTLADAVRVVEMRRK
jgi:uncharacterized protein involved in exopolysaccharide biosynthesis